MANPTARGSSLFSGLALVFVGVILLLHNYHGLHLGRLFGRWWPLLIIVWGAIKLFERAAAQRASDPSAARISSGEILLVLGLLSLVGVVVLGEKIKGKVPEDVFGGSETISFDLNLEPKTIPADARITISIPRGGITVRPSDESQIRVAGKKNIKAWSETEADHIASAISVEVVPNGDGYEVRPAGGSDTSRVSMDLDISVPKNAALTIRSEKGDVSVSEAGKSVVIDAAHGNVEVRDAGGDVTIDTRKGDVIVSDTKGSVKIEGRGGEINVSGTTGGLTIDGEFRGPIRADKIARGVRFVSHRTDLTISQLRGHMETSPGSLEIADALGNLTLRADSDDISIENAMGKLKIENRNGNIEVRFSNPPKEDIEITNSSAPITLGLPESASFEIVADCHSCDIDSEFSGDSLRLTSTPSHDSHLEGKYGTGRGPKIILKTSYGSISIHKIS